MIHLKDVKIILWITTVQSCDYCSYLLFLSEVDPYPFHSFDQSCLDKLMSEAPARYVLGRCNRQVAGQPMWCPPIMHGVSVIQILKKRPQIHHKLVV